MVSNNGFDGKKSITSVDGSDKKSIGSKSSVSEKSVGSQRRPKSSSACEAPTLKKTLRIRPKTVETNESSEKRKSRTGKIDPIKSVLKSPQMKSDKKKSETSLRKKDETEPEAKKTTKPTVGKPMEGQKEAEKTSSGVLAVSRESKSKISLTKKSSEIPKPKSLTKTNITIKSGSTISKLPVKTTRSEESKESVESGKEKNQANNGEQNKEVSKAIKGKRDGKAEEKVKEALKEKFCTIVPIWETELRKITEAWVNTIYCSLTMRAHLVKLLFQAFPNINRSQFQTEDEKLLNCIANAKSYTKSEVDGLMQFVKSLITNRDKAKEQYRYVLANKEMAEIHNHDWRKLTRKIAETGEEMKQVHLEVMELQKKKEETSQPEKIKNMETILASKEEEVQKLINQLNILKQKESSYKGNVFLKVQDYKDIKADVMSLKSTEKEYEELKIKFVLQKEAYEKSIRELEMLLEEKSKLLEKERNVKNQLEAFWCHLQEQQKKLTTTVGKEQVEYVLGNQCQSERDKRRQQLWLAAAKLVIKGFLVQTKKLERDRNKMLLELQSNDSKNFDTVVASIFRKENFIKSIKTQIESFERANKNLQETREENCWVEGS